MRARQMGVVQGRIVTAIVLPTARSQGNLRRVPRSSPIGTKRPAHRVRAERAAMCRLGRLERRRLSDDTHGRTERG